MQNKNSSTTQEIRDVARSQDAVEALPSSFSPSIQLVAETNPKLLRRVNVLRNVSLQNVASGTVYTVPTGKRFILLGAVLTFIKDATSTSTDISVRVPLDDGSTIRLINQTCLTLTAQSGSVPVSIPQGIPVPPGSVISAVSSSAVANVSYSATVWGYLEDL